MPGTVEDTAEQVSARGGRGIPVRCDHTAETEVRKLVARIQRIYEKPAEPVFQTFELPLSAFAAAAPGFDPARLRAVRLRFDRTPASVIVLSEVGFGEEQE